jgi:chromosome segregation ATPase
MILAINDKDIQIEDLKNWVDGLKHNEETIKHKLTKEVNDLKQRVDGQCTTIRLKDEEIDNLKYNVKFSVEKRHNADRQYEDKYKAYDSKIKELDEKIVSLQNELTHERNYKEILIENMEKCFKGCKEQLHFLDLYKKNSLYYLEELNKFTTNNT